MNILKRVLQILLVLIVVALIAAAILPKDIHVERSRTINAPTAAVFNQVNNLRNWENWSPWAKMDPAMKVSYSGAAQGAGASYSWQGPEVGGGQLTISESVPFSSIKTELSFDQGEGKGTWIFVDKGSQTEVAWMMDTHMSWPSNLFGLTMDAMLGPTFEDGLANIEKQLSK